MWILITSESWRDLKGLRVNFEKFLPLQCTCKTKKAVLFKALKNRIFQQDKTYTMQLNASNWKYFVIYFCSPKKIATSYALVAVHKWHPHLAGRRCQGYRISTICMGMCGQWEKTRKSADVILWTAPYSHKQIINNKPWPWIK